MEKKSNVNHYQMYIDLLYKSTHLYKITIEDLLSSIFY
jgi:hypothetical protein